MNNIKKPPRDINELNKPGGGEGEHKQGPLTYAGDPGKKADPGGGGGPGRPARPKLNYTQLVIAVGISVLIFFVISNFTLASKNDALTLLDNQRLLEVQTTAVQTQLNSETGRIENIIAAQAGFAQKSELTNYARVSELSGLSDSIDSLSGLVTTAASDIESLDTRITEIENGGGGGGSYCFLSRTLNGFTLTAESSITGYFLAEVTLILDIPSELLYVAGTGRSFIENIGYVGGYLKVVSITFYTGEFKLDVGEVKDNLEIPLNLSMEIENIGYRAYVELLPSAVTTTSGGDVI